MQKARLRVVRSLDTDRSPPGEPTIQYSLYRYVKAT